MKININNTDDWDLIVKLCHFNHQPHLPVSLYNEIYKKAWQFTDAYGTPGYLPPQGYDWSGFRDSSPESHTMTAKMIRSTLNQAGFTEFEVEMLS